MVHHYGRVLFEHCPLSATSDQWNATHIRNSTEMQKKA